ncbi:uncharacterized protein LOC135093900 isoform X2 [Scylla paramamosain]|uniref:uncharacterized protein LOC135093900 isoform X2 n=1 Tax=Scylla paramamosain TaxID=85552 RepID=UPI0030835929
MNSLENPDNHLCGLEIYWMFCWFQFKQRRGGRVYIQLLFLLLLLLLFFFIYVYREEQPEFYLHSPPPPTKYISIYGRGGGGGGREGGEPGGRAIISRHEEEEEEEELREVLEEALHLLSSPTYTCRKLIAMGGYSCNYKTDGEKYVCHDPPVYVQGVYCLVYALGAGHDFTFDAHMAKFGCEVYTFDDDYAHRNYPTHMGDRLWFYKIRVGTHFVKQYYFSTSSSTNPQVIHYGPLPAIRARLGHNHNHLHFLKMDIEGDEWSVMEESLFKVSGEEEGGGGGGDGGEKNCCGSGSERSNCSICFLFSLSLSLSLSQSNILQQTQQVGLEVHLDGLKTTGNKTHPTPHLLNMARRYLRVVTGLRQHGFHLAHWEPNFRGSEVITVAGVTFHVYFETLWVNLKFQGGGRNMPATRLLPSILFPS